MFKKPIYLILFFVFSCVFAISLLCGRVFAADVVPGIDANGSDGPVTLAEGDNLTVTVALDPGSHTGEDADWWVYATSPFGTYWYTLSGWRPADDPIRVYGGPLFNLPRVPILNIATLPVGEYGFYFAVDGNMDGNMDATYLDSVLVTIASGGINSYNLPDTGQTGDYTPIFGEDSDYTINPPSHTDNGNGTVTDNNTGLMWQQEDDNNLYTWDEAISYCDNLSLAGYSDWRLPEINELTGIVDYGTYGPVIDEVYFPGTNSSFYWSSTTHVDRPDYAFFVGFYDGYVIYFHKLDTNISARCVRGGQNTADFTDNGNGTVTDNITGFMWQQVDDNTTRVWESAIKYCEGLSLAGYNDWRLPNIRELRSIVDYDEFYPAIDETYFPATNPLDYWSSTTYVPNTGNAWLVYFYNGRDHYSGKSNAYYAKCVRGEGN